MKARRMCLLRAIWRSVGIRRGCFGGECRKSGSSAAVMAGMTGDDVGASSSSAWPWSNVDSGASRKVPLRRADRKVLRELQIMIVVG